MVGDVGDGADDTAGTGGVDTDTESEGEQPAVESMSPTKPNGAPNVGSGGRAAKFASKSTPDAVGSPVAGSGHAVPRMSRLSNGNESLEVDMTTPLEKALKKLSEVQAVLAPSMAGEHATVLSEAIALVSSAAVTVSHEVDFGAAAAARAGNHEMASFLSSNLSAAGSRSEDNKARPRRRSSIRLTKSKAMNLTFSVVASSRTQESSADSDDDER